MINIIATPPSRAPRLPSLEPHQPRSGTTGVPAASLARRRQAVPRQPSPLLESSSEEDCERKLDALIVSMEDVLKGYAGYPSRAPTYMATLHRFHQRALNLKAPQVGIQTPDESACEKCPDEYFPRKTPAYIPGDISPTHPNQPRRSPRPVPHSTSPVSPTDSCDHLRTPTRSPQPRSPSPPTQEVKRLAREWWGSEVAAAWYGPRPRARPSHSLASRRRKQSAEEERERLRRSLEDLEIKSTGESERARKDKMEKDREQSIKRESSFVGLYDE